MMYRMCRMNLNDEVEHFREAMIEALAEVDDDVADPVS